MQTRERESYGAAGLFTGPGEMAARCREYDWSATALGPIEAWSRSLRTMSAAVLASRNPMLLFWGPDLIQFYNDAFRPSLGAADVPGARHPRALGMRAAEFWTDVWDVVGPQIEGVMTRGEAVWFENLHLPIERDGRMDDAWWTYSYSPVLDDDGRVNGTLVVCLETTATVRAMKALDAQRAEAEKANRAKADFLAMMSHELRTPLNAIDGYAELLELEVHGPVSDPQRAALDRIRRSQRHLLGLINGVLNYAKVDAGKVHYDIESIPLAEVLATCETFVVPQARMKGLHVVCEDCPDSVVVRADREKVQQIVLNLLSNAVKFTDAGGRVTMQAVCADDRVTVTVSDTGRGIASDRLESVFQPFVQVDTTLTRRNDGVGLGLAISRDLARGMGGDITAVSEPGTGSTFVLSLPRART
jgi:signal transduction histidine kinase